MITAGNIARAVREPGYTRPTPGTKPPPTFLTVPPRIAAKAVRLHHLEGPRAARRYLYTSKVGSWANHRNPSMASSNSNVLAGFEAYILADGADGRSALQTGRTVIVERPAGPLKVYLDVVLGDKGRPRRPGGALGRAGARRIPGGADRGALL